MALHFPDCPTAEDGGWHPEIIKTAVRLKGMSLTKLARDNGLPESSCRIALIRPHTDADRVISSFLNVPLSELWPSRYDDEGNTIRHERDNSILDREETHRQFSAVA